MSKLYPSRTVVVCAAPARRDEASALAGRLGIACADHLPAEPGWLALVLDDTRLALRLTGPGAPGAVAANFVEGRGGRRARSRAPRGEALARAAGLRGARRPEVIDTTAGLGRDGFLLAAFGCHVTLIERHPVIAAVLRDGLARAADAGAPASGRIDLIEADARAVLRARVADVVLVDPMHPPRRKAAAVRKEMRLFQALLGGEEDGRALLEAARRAARRRVVVKRPADAPPLADGATGSVVERSTRFDIYPGGAAA